jgi:hypothetical protein
MSNTRAWLGHSCAGKESVCNLPCFDANLYLRSGDHCACKLHCFSTDSNLRWEDHWKEAWRPSSFHPSFHQRACSVYQALPACPRIPKGCALSSECRAWSKHAGLCTRTAPWSRWPAWACVISMFDKAAVRWGRHVWIWGLCYTPVSSTCVQPNLGTHRCKCLWHTHKLTHSYTHAQPPFPLKIQAHKCAHTFTSMNTHKQTHTHKYTPRASRKALPQPGVITRRFLYPVWMILQRTQGASPYSLPCRKGKWTQRDVCICVCVCVQKLCVPFPVEKGNEHREMCAYVCVCTIALRSLLCRKGNEHREMCAYICVCVCTKAPRSLPCGKGKWTQR